MILLLISFIAGILTILAPCVLPLLLVIVGGSIGQGKSLKKAITVTVSLAVSVILFTLLIKASTILIGIPAEFWKGFSGGIIIVFGLITLFPGLWEKIPFLAKLSIGGNKVLASGYKKKSVWGDVIVGASLGPVFSTCSPTYFLVLAAVLPENFVLGIIYLIAYSVGLSLALLAVAFVGQKVVNKIGVAADPRGKFKKVLGIIFILVGIAIVTGFDKTLQVNILDAGFFDVTKIEQKLLEFVPSDTNQVNKINMQENEVKSAAVLSLAEKSKKFVLATEISTPNGFVNTNGKPITLNELRGKVVLLDIWTYSCINCQRTIPHINDWYKKYQDKGLEIIGLHTPEFAFEQIQKNVEKAVEGFNIKYPVVLDNDYSTWNAYGNRYWPRKYLIDIDGYIVYDHIGEGGYKETEEAIQKALAERNTRLNITSVSMPDISKIDNNGWGGNVGSPETYFGSARNDQQKNLLFPNDSWDIKPEFAQSNSANASIIYTYTAKDVFFVAEAGTETTVEVLLDEKPLGSLAGADIFKTSDGKTVIKVKEARLYKIIQGEKSETHTLKFIIQKSGLKAFTFTFG